MAKGKKAAPKGKKAAPKGDLKQSKFANKALVSVGNMYEAMFALDSGDTHEVRKLAGKWGIKLTDDEADKFIEKFIDVQGKKLDPDALRKLT